MDNTARQGTSAHPPRRNISTASLAGPSSQQRFPGASTGDHLISAGFPAAMAGPAHMALPATGLSASATTVMIASQPNSTGGQQVYAEQQHQIKLQQQLSPFSMMSTASSSSSNSPTLGAVLASDFAPAQACMPGPAGPRVCPVGSACMAPASSSNLSTVQYSSSFLQPAVSCTASGLAPDAGSVLQMPVLAMQGADAQSSAVLGPGVHGIAAASPQTSYSYTGTEGVAGHAPGMLAGSSGVLLSGPQVNSTDSITAQWAALGLPEHQMLAALLEESGQDSNLELQQDEIQQHINKLSLMKQILRLKQQHKAQQRMLQQQQRQLEQLLQEQLLHNKSSVGSSQCAETQQLQQELFTLLQKRSGEAALPLSVSVTAAPPALQINTVPVAHTGAFSVVSRSTVGPSMLTGLLPAQQQPLQFGQSTLQTADAASLSALLQERMSLRDQQGIQSAPINLFTPQQPHAAVMHHSTVQHCGAQPSQVSCSRAGATCDVLRH